MARFAYKAKDSSGRIKTGSVEGKSKASVKELLRRQRLVPLSVKAEALDAAEGESGFLSNIFTRDDKGRIQIEFASQKVTAKDLIIFTKQFSTMIDSGVPMIQSLGILASQQRVKAFGKKLERIRLAVENGATLSEALEAYPRIFDPLYVAMVRAGEASGSLDTILMKLVTYIEKSAKIKAQVKSAMMYPLIVVCVAITVITGLLLFVVPTFAKQFSDSGKPLPGLTQAVIDFSNLLARDGVQIAAGAAVAFFLFRSWTRTDEGRKRWDRILLLLPGLGDLLRKVAVGRFCSTMASMLTSGVSILEALNICAASSGNKTIEAFVLNIREKISAGRTFAEPLGEGSLFPPMVVSMVAVGETTGALDDMLLKVSEFYEEEVDQALKTVLSMIEPIMIVVIGGVVGFIVIAMYLPIFDLASTVGA